MKLYIGSLTTGALTLTCGAVSCHPEEARNPNIVIILADDMGYGDVGALNPASKIPTPNIDRIARAGVTFTDAHSTSSVSTPSRYSLLTGRYNWRSTMKQGVGGGYAKPLIAPDRTTIGSVLQRRGYTTACIGKWHLGWDWARSDEGDPRVNGNVDFSRPIAEGPTTRGFDYFYGISASLDMAPYVYVENDRATVIPDRIAPDFNDDVAFWREGPISSDFDHAAVLENLTDRACDYIAEKAAQDRPYMLYVPLTAPHTPVMPSAGFEGKSGLGLYADFVMMVDSEVGRLLSAVGQSGEEANTIVVFASDNGCAPYIHPEELVEKGHLPSGGFRGYKSDIYDGGHRIPLMMKWPARIAPHTVDETVCLTDMMATFAAITGYELAPNEGEDSFDLSGHLLGRKSAAPVRDITVHSSNDGSLAVRHGDWKLVTISYSGGWGHPVKAGSEGLPAVQLYNMKDDPAEAVNLHESRPDVVAELFDRLTACVENGRSTSGEAQSNDPPRWWRQLNWIERPAGK